MTTSPRLEATQLEEAQAQAQVPVNDGQQRFDAFANQIVIKDRDLTAPPGGEANGDAYIPAAAATGAWTGHEGEIALFIEGWVVLTILVGMSIYVEDEKQLLYFDGTDLIEIDSDAPEAIALAATPVISSRARTIKIPVVFGDFTAAATTEAISLIDVPAGTVLESVKLKHSIPFTGGGSTTMTLSVGNAGTPAKYATAFDVFQATGPLVFQVENLIGGESHTALSQIDVVATSDVNVNLLTAGAAEIWVTLRRAT